MASGWLFCERLHRPSAQHWRAERETQPLRMPTLPRPGARASIPTLQSRERRGGGATHEGFSDRSNVFSCCNWTFRKHPTCHRDRAWLSQVMARRRENGAVTREWLRVQQFLFAKGRSFASLLAQDPGSWGAGVPERTPEAWQLSKPRTRQAWAVGRNVDSCGQLKLWRNARPVVRHVGGKREGSWQP